MMRASAAAVVFAALVFATCARCQETQAPSHWTSPPSTEEFAALAGKGHVVALSAETWSGVLKRLEIAEAEHVELEASRRALAATREALALVQDQQAQDRDDGQTIADGDRALLRCERVKRGWVLVSFGLGGYVAARELD